MPTKPLGMLTNVIPLGGWFGRGKDVVIFALVTDRGHQTVLSCREESGGRGGRPKG